ncbi:hypothetical protein Mal15_56790 [Stieleria maiorica]|uniref:Uncharacterized protein n=1 Tax=Stieleria maiorica TaxID=2795974 RepID=A0A5B9MK02_9BACT|nr:hypothetical protein [Stieleria maiorica]QEG01602.1 hypothetical protein Mal15_56790 [Stieleria maiorica]
MTLSELVEQWYALHRRLAAVNSSTENKRLDNGDWYDTIGDKAVEMLEELQRFCGHSDELDLLIDEVSRGCEPAQGLPTRDQLRGLKELDPNPDGPVLPKGWRHAGHVYTNIEPRPSKLVSFLWKLSDRSAEWDDLAEPVWGDRAATLKEGQAVESACRKANKFFRDNKIPWKVSYAAAPDYTVTLKKTV